MVLVFLTKKDSRLRSLRYLDQVLANDFNDDKESDSDDDNRNKSLRWVNEKVLKSISQYSARNGEIFWKLHVEMAFVVRVPLQPNMFSS